MVLSLWTFAIAVSYTHLDVYKRQVHDGSGPLTIAFQGFEGTADDTWAATAIDATLVRNTRGASDTPANQRVRTGSYSWQPGQGEYTTESMELGEVDISQWSDVVLTLSLIHI